MSTERPVASTVDELLAGAESRQPVQTGDSKSGARFERVMIDGQPHMVKYLHVDDDWIMRSSGDLGCRPLESGGFSRHELSEAWALQVYRDVKEILSQIHTGPLAPLIG
jgi:hypothetical protein